jgi:hypothetical protein
MDVIEQTAVTLPTKVAVTAQTIGFVAGATIVGAVVVGVVLYRKRKTKKAETTVVETVTN